jgi:NAD(P)-dependent dehydrogenase (short-subunit alcohol dehydrogenase family)
MPTTGRVAVVTGGASGIGRALVERWLTDGGAVVVVDSDAAVAAAYETELASRGQSDKVAFVHADVSDEADIAHSAAAAVDTFGGIDAWFSNAGITGVWAPTVDIEVADFDRVVAVLLRGVFLGAKHAARQMIAQGRGGAIVNTASVGGLVGGGGPMVYSAAKAGVLSMTRSMAVELGPHRIRVNAVCPGAILTPMMHRGDPEAAIQRLNGRQPWPDYGRPEHLASVMAFLASDDATFVTGEAVVVDGGLVAEGIKIVPPAPQADERI